jgi:Uma2 family endonuclease
MVTTTRPTTIPAEEMPPVGITFDEYLEKYAGDFYEWVGGEVVKMSPVHDRHDALSRYFARLFEIYFELKSIGTIRQAPFVMKLESTERGREPDLQIILHTNANHLTPTYMDGPADIVIEIVSPESAARDHGEKLIEYEKGKIPEYWIIDPIHKEARFYRLDENGVYAPQNEDASGNYTTPALPDLVINVPELWQEELPGPIAITRKVEEMFKD